MERASANRRGIVAQILSCFMGGTASATERLHNAEAAELCCILCGLSVHSSVSSALHCIEDLWNVRRLIVEELLRRSCRVLWEIPLLPLNVCTTQTPQNCVASSADKIDARRSAGLVITATDTRHRIPISDYR